MNVQKITKFDRAAAENARRSFLAEMEEVAKKYGLSMEVGSIKYSDTLLRTPNLTFKVDTPEVAARDEIHMTHMLNMHGLKLDAVFTVKGVTHKITGYDGKRRSKCILVTPMNGPKKGMTLIAKPEDVRFWMGVK